MTKLLLATNNRGKLTEYYRLLDGVPFRLVSLAEEGISQPVEETQDTIEGNARLKAVAYASLSRLLTLADDSCLEVDAIGGEPGVRSARYLGEGVSFKERMDYILKRLEGVPREKRTARFRCCIALASPDGAVQLFHGECPGIIAYEARGSQGFGYDPIFLLPELGRTMAELSMDEKNRVSHRAVAARKARAALLSYRHSEPDPEPVEGIRRRIRPGDVGRILRPPSAEEPALSPPKGWPQNDTVRGHP